MARALEERDTSRDDEKDEAAGDALLRADGTVTDVQCKVQDMQITVITQSGSVILHAADNTKIDFISDVRVESEVFWPCTSLKGRIVRVKYVPATPSKMQQYQGEIASVEIRR